MSGRATNRTGGRPFPVSRHRPTTGAAGRFEAIPACPKEGDQDPTTRPRSTHQERKEGDLDRWGSRIRSAIGTLVERRSRFTILLHLPGRHTAEAVRDGIIAAFAPLPPELCRSLTWDQGSELALHTEIAASLGMSGVLLRTALAVAASQQREHCEYRGGSTGAVRPGWCRQLGVTLENTDRLFGVSFI